MDLNREITVDRYMLGTPPLSLRVPLGTCRTTEELLVEQYAALFPQHPSPPKKAATPSHAFPVATAEICKGTHR
jgi:hypothetical protein